MGRVSEMPELAVAQKLISQIARGWLGTLYLASRAVAGAAVIYAGTIIYGAMERRWFTDGDNLFLLAHHP